jgi:hypothetical protein
MGTAAIICSIMGGACELAGLWLVVLGIRDDQRRARTLFDKPLTITLPRRSYPGRSPGASVPSSTAWASGLQGTPQSRIVNRITSLEASVRNAFIKLKQVMDEQDDGNVQVLHKAQVDGDNELSQRLKEALTGSLTGRAWGAGLLGVGIVLGVAGSILSNL